jgi:hypothetical protein
MNIYRGDNRPSAERADAQSQAIAKIAFLTSMFEKLVAEAGLRRERIEQLLAEIAEERAGAPSPATAESSVRRAA